jgi:hypothetical protein
MEYSRQSWVCKEMIVVDRSRVNRFPDRQNRTFLGKHLILFVSCVFWSGPALLVPVRFLPDPAAKRLPTADHRRESFCHLYAFRERTGQVLYQ